MKLTDRYRLTVWTWFSPKGKRLSNPRMLKNEINVSRSEAVRLRDFYERKGYDVKSWPLTEEELAERTK